MILKYTLTFLVILTIGQLNARNADTVTTSENPQVELKTFPYDSGDSLSFDNLRFLRYKFTNDPISKTWKNVMGYYCHLDTLQVINASNRFTKYDLERIWKAKPGSIVIDSVFFVVDGQHVTQRVNKSIALFYPKTNEYAMLESETGLWSGYHSNSLRSVTSFPDKQTKRLHKSTEPKLEVFEMSRVTLNYPYLNLGELAGVNLITVKDRHGNLLFERKIDGTNQRIEDFFENTGYDELYITVRGSYTWDLVFRYL